VATCISGCGVCSECRAACDSQVARHSEHTPQPETHVVTTLQNL